MHRVAVASFFLLTTGVFALAQPAFHVQTIAGSNYAGDGRTALQALLLQAEGVAAAPDGSIFIADAADHRIRAISPSGIIRTLAGDGSPGADGDGGPAEKAHLNTPYGLSLDRQGNLFLADLGNARIRLITPEGRIRTVAGGGEIPASETSEGSPATSLKLKTPRNVLADSNGGFYFSDFDAHRVYYVDFRGILTIFAGTGTPGYGADNISATRSSLRNPAGLALEPLGGIIIVESGAQRLRRVARGTVTSYLADALRNYPLYSPTGIAFDTAGNLYLADARSTGALKRTPQGEITALPLSGRAVAAHPRGGAIYAWNAAVYHADAANKISPIAGARSGLAELSGDGGPAADARLLAPAAIAYDRDGNLYIADERAHRVRRVSPAGIISTIAGNGTPAFSGDGGPANLASLNTPRGLAFDQNGFLYIADSGNHAVRRVAPSGLITSAAGNGFPGFRGDGGPASAAMLNSPSTVAVDSSNTLFIADTANHRVRRVNTGGIITTYAGTGTPGLQYDGAAAVYAQLNEPRGLAFDPTGNLYIADSANNRIRRVDLTGLLTTIGEPNFSLPRGLAIAADGAIYVADTGNHRICLLTPTSAVPINGETVPGLRGDGGPASAALFQSPSALAFDSYGNLAIADMGNGRIRQLKPEAPLLSALSISARISNAASNVEGPVAPGMLATLRGDDFGPTEPVAAPAGAPWPRLLGGVDIYVDGEAAPLLYVSADQINFQIPYSVAGRQTTAIEIYYRGLRKARADPPVAAAAPGLFPQIITPDGTPNSAQNPLARGSVATLYVTGTGTAPLESIEIRAGGMPAPVIWAGQTAGLPGILQVNFRLPSGFFAPGSLAISFRIGSAAAPPGVSVFLQ